MAKMTKVVFNDKKIVGVVWDSNGKEVISLDKDMSIDLNMGLKVSNADDNEYVFIDLIDLVSDAVNRLNN